MTQSYQNCRDYLASLCDCENNAQCKYHPQYYLRKNTEVFDVLDGPKQECFPICHKCDKLIEKGTGKEFTGHPNDVAFPPTWFHHECFNRYEHYYGLDKPAD